MVGLMLILVGVLGVVSMVTGLLFLRIVALGLGVLYLILHLRYRE